MGSPKRPCLDNGETGSTSSTKPDSMQAKILCLHRSQEQTEFRQGMMGNS
jgi:hypothetical protein